MGASSSQLLEACRTGDHETVTRLLDSGVPLDCRTKGEYYKNRGLPFTLPSYHVVGAGKSPLQLALLAGSLDTVRVLLDRGGDPNERFKKDKHAHSVWRPAEWVDDLGVFSAVPRTPMSEAREKMDSCRPGWVDPESGQGDWAAIVALLRERGAVEVDVNGYGGGGGVVATVKPKSAANVPTTAH